MREKELEPAVARFLQEQGYRTYFDPDGSGYFDAVALHRERDRVGLIELKVADWKRVFEQALLRRGWGDWVAVVLPRRSLGAKVLGRPAPPIARAVGVWVVEAGRIVVLREAGPLRDLPGAEAFNGLRDHLRRSLELLDSGLLPPGTEWRILRRPRRGGPVGRRVDVKHWTLEELTGSPAPSPTPTPGEDGGSEGSASP